VSNDLSQEGVLAADSGMTDHGCHRCCPVYLFSLLVSGGYATTPEENRFRDRDPLS
jgi:hypothetical protein